MSSPLLTFSRQNRLNAAFLAGNKKSLWEFEREAGIDLHNNVLRKDVQWCQCLLPFFLSCPVTLTFEGQDLTTECSPDSALRLINNKLRSVNEEVSLQEQIMQRVAKFLNP